MYSKFDHRKNEYKRVDKQIQKHKRRRLYFSVKNTNLKLCTTFMYRLKTRLLEEFLEGEQKKVPGDLQNNQSHFYKQGKIKVIVISVLWM